MEDTKGKGHICMAELGPPGSLSLGEGKEKGDDSLFSGLRIGKVRSKGKEIWGSGERFENVGGEEVFIWSGRPV